MLFLVSMNMFRLCFISVHIMLCHSHSDWNLKKLPGADFNLTYRQHTGFLDSEQGKNPAQIFYWLVESQSEHPEKDPVIFWFNGGPGCSSLRGNLHHFIGPLQVADSDGKTLLKNPLSWNQIAHLVFIESPARVGFSQVSGNFESLDDDEVAKLNFQNIQSFFEKHEEFRIRPFFIAGVSYFGVYGPTLARLILTNASLATRLKGMAIGNGLHSFEMNSRWSVLGAFNRGYLSKRQFNDITKACCSNATTTRCNYNNYTENCYVKVHKYHGFPSPAGFVFVKNNDIYNYNQDCYNEEDNTLQSMHPRFSINVNSTDAINGFPCWNDKALTAYLNRKDVQAAIGVLEVDKIKKKTSHVKKNVQDKATVNWSMCNDRLHLGGPIYQNIYPDMSSVYADIIKGSPINMTILIYSGDDDTLVDFRAAEEFVEDVVAKNNLKELRPRQVMEYRGALAGFSRIFERFHLLTIKGAGHYATMDRPGPALQMMANFIKGSDDYSIPFNA